MTLNRSRLKARLASLQETLQSRFVIRTWLPFTGPAIAMQAPAGRTSSSDSQ